MSLNDNFNAIEGQRSESFVEAALSQVSFMELENVEEIGRPVSVHDICANTDVSRPTEPEAMGRRGDVFDSEGEEEDDEGEVIVRSIQIDVSEQSHSTMEPILEEELFTSVEIDRRASHQEIAANGPEDGARRLALPRAASHSGVGTSSSVQKFIQKLSWKRRTKSDTNSPGDMPTLDEEAPKPEQQKRPERKGLFGRRKQKDRSRQTEAQPATPNAHLTSGETAPAMTPKVFQSYFHNALDGKVDTPVTTEDDTIDYSAYIL
ncbi:uncharacterized protein LOC117334495 [Pecten maximus]|uniref:uncharacterized protein LOC117334495 n=1 Tax=Pecten maximus TaxID=6579 RepID=UPI001457F70A|nr:uncharacterized protein LOC117334495 [Pecten maximus]